MWTIDGFNNESDVEQKLILPLLIHDHGLSYPPSEVYTKAFVQERNIGKRKSRRGHIPDYLVYAHGIPCLIIEAKAPGQDLAEALREASAYALEINRQYQANCNPLQHVAACNGDQLVVCAWDNVTAPAVFAVPELRMGSAALTTLQEMLGFDILAKQAAVMRRQIYPELWRNPIRVAGGTAIQNRTRRWNRFAEQLQPLIARFLAKDQPRDAPDIVDRGYVTSDERTTYERTLESLLKDNATKRIRPDATIVSTSVRHEGRTRKQILAGEYNGSATTTLLIGGVGAGKSMFVDRFHQLYLGDKEGVLWILIDFNAAPQDPSEFGSWICREFIDRARQEAHRFGEDPDSLSFAKKLFGRQIAKSRALLVGGEKSGAMADADFDAWIRKQLIEWLDDARKVVAAFFDHFRGERQFDISVVFDNADKRTSEEQLAVFQHALAFAAEHRCSTIIAMRDETYDIYASKPPLDAISKHRIYRIEPPRLIDVVSKRLQMMNEYLEAQLPDRLSYSIPNGAVVEYSKAELSQYIKTIFDDIFATHRSLREMVEAVAGKNIRKALEMFAAILVSPYLSETQVGLGARFGSTIPEWSVLRALLRGRYAFYSDLRGESYIHNIYQVSERQPDTSNFLVPEVLAILVRERKRTGELGVEGYVRVARLLQAPELMSFSAESILWAVEYCIEGDLVTAEAVEAKKIDANAHVKITASGFFHLKVLNRRQEYIANVAMSTWLRDEDAASEIADSLQVQRDGAVDHRHQAERRYSRFTEYLRIEADRHRQLASCEPDRLVGVALVAEAIAAIDAFRTKLTEGHSRH